MINALKEIDTKTLLLVRKTLELQIVTEIDNLARDIIDNCLDDEDIDNQVCYLKGINMILKLYRWELLNRDNNDEPQSNQEN